MSAVTLPVIDAPIDTRSMAIRTLDELLSADDVDPRDVHGAMLALSDDDLSHYGLRSYRMNLMALLGDRARPDAIARSAREATLSKMWLGWEYHQHYLPGLDTAPAPIQLERFPVDTVQAMLAQGRGAIVATFHFGHMRHVPSDLAHAGIPVMMPLARDAYGNYESARQNTPDAALWRYLRHVCVEDAAGTLSLARHLAKGGCVFSTIDGNTGMDGPRGSDRRSTVSMLDTQVRVKNGLIAMAARFGVPILPVITTTVDGARVCDTAPIIDPLGPLVGDQAALFVEEALASLYGLLADTLLRSAGEWCGGDLFHQWRVPHAVADEPAQQPESRLVHTLQQRGSVSFDVHRTMLLSATDERVFVDVKTMKCYRLPLADADLADRLLDPLRGVDQGWIEGLDEARRPNVWRFLCLMASRGMLDLDPASVQSPA